MRSNQQRCAAPRTSILVTAVAGISLGFVAWSLSAEAADASVQSIRLAPAASWTPHSTEQRPAGTPYLEQVGTMYPTNFDQMVFGDTDHDQKNEAILYVQDAAFTFHYRVLEHQGGNVYSDEYSGDELIPYAVGDLDGDGKSDLVGQEGAKIRVYESSTPSTYPTQLVWQSLDLMNVESFIAIGDTDQDGRKEILYSYNPFSGTPRFYIFENVSDNSYAQVYNTPLSGNDNTGEKVIADFDRDGRIEIAFGGLLGNLYVYESTGNNLWTRTLLHATGMSNAYACKGGIDTNGNGRAEIFLSGIGDFDWETHVFEATGNDQWSEVALLHENDGYLGRTFTALGDLDGTPPAEFMMEGNSHFWVYRAGGLGWQKIAQVDDPLGAGHIGLQAYDANDNGRTEIFWDGDNPIHFADRTLILERPLAPSGVPSTAAPMLLSLAPNPMGDEVRILGAMPLEPAARAEWIDALGRRHEATFQNRSAAPMLDTRALPAGVYWLQLADRDGRLVATARAVRLR